MNTELFNLDFSRWQILLLYLMPASINIIIFFVFFLTADRTRTTTYFSIFVLFLGLWQMGDSFTKLSRTYEMAATWNRIAGVFVLVLIPFGIQFILCFAGWFKRKFSRVLSIFLFLPAIVFFVFIEGRLDEYQMLRSDTVYWIVNPKPTPITLSIYIWVALGAICKHLPYSYPLKLF